MSYMRVLSIGMDRKLFEENSAVLARSLDYASKMEELHIIVFSLRKHKLSFKKINNLYLYPTNSFSRISFLWGAYSLGKNILTKNNFVQNQSVITAQDPMSIIAYFLAKKFKFPFQLQIHTDIFSTHFKKSFVTWFNFWYSGLVQVPITSFLIPRSSGIRVVSEPIKNSILNKFPKLKVSPDVLPVYVDVKSIIDATPTINAEKEFPHFKFIIFMASRLTREKRIDVAIHALRRVISEFPHTGLVIAGSGPEKNNLIRKARQMGIERNIDFIGWKNDLISYFKTVDMYLLTSEYEGYGMTLVEAGASGCPIVTTRVGLAKTGLFKNGQNSMICEVGDYRCISEKILELIHDNSKRELFKRSMLLDIQKDFISKDEYVEKYVALLENLISKK